MNKRFLKFRKRLWDVNEGYRLVILVEKEEEMGEVPAGLPVVDFTLGESQRRAHILSFLISNTERSYKV
jgi:hypothetical protein